MPFLCPECDKFHEDLPRYFLWRAPETPDLSVIEVTQDRKSMCRAPSGECFVHCEIEVPITGSAEDPLGFICWVQVSEADFDRLLHYRAHEDTEPEYTELVQGVLSNPLAGVPGSYGTRVAFRILKDDPTPYVRWVDPDSQLAERICTGASPAFWHEVHALMTPPQEPALAADTPLTIECGNHGTRPAACVCVHMLLAKDDAVGFVENGADANDLQAWCDRCEEFFLQENGLTQAFEEFNDRAIVCDVCYAGFKAKHSRPEH